MSLENIHFHHRQMYLLSFLMQSCWNMLRKCLIRRVRFILTVFIGLLIYFCFLIHLIIARNHERSAHLTLNTDGMSNSRSILSSNQTQSSRLVLLWTDLFDDYYWHQASAFDSLTTLSCEKPYRCHFTRDRTQLSQASLVAFHLYDINRSQLPTRKSKVHENQTWLFVTGESPINFYYQNPSFYPRLLDNYFDVAISYKFDSPWSIFSASIRQHSAMTTDMSINEMKYNRDSLTKKTKPIVWFVSNCNTFSQREKYVHELSRFISIDIYGKCGQMCSNGQCQVDLDQYYFYLSFENSRCHSYITEKFWNIIMNNDHRLVPIVMGASEADYARVAPDQSYIHVNQYPTPEKLADQLHYLIRHPNEYLRYLQWREKTHLDTSNQAEWTNFLCPFCQIAHEQVRSETSRIEFSSWFDPATQCHQSDVELFGKCKQTNLNVWMSWIHNVKCP
jgi:alpha-1,3-fucosyltransferase